MFKENQRFMLVPLSKKIIQKVLIEEILVMANLILVFEPFTKFNLTVEDQNKDSKYNSNFNQLSDQKDKKLNKNEKNIKKTSSTLMLQIVEKKPRNNDKFENIFTSKL